MMIVRPNERSPRVALIQILLNRLGADLKVDGVYGDKTRTAVNKFRQSNGFATSTGIVDASVWQKLPLGDNTEVVDVLDMADPVVGGMALSELKKAGGDPIQLGLMCGGVEQMVTSVAAAAGKAGSVALLRIIGHGNYGRWFTVSIGAVAHQAPDEYAVSASEFHSYIDLSHLDQLIPALSPLKKYFAPYGMMEHGGCSLGSKPDTRKMMQRLADLWNVPVSVGIGIQKSILNFDGPTYSAYPKGGTLDSWSSAFR